MENFPQPRAAYLHVPFCRHRCGYCDFTLVAGRDDLIASYLAALEKDLQTLGSPQSVDTIFLGGGTPTHLSVEDLARLLELVSRWFPLAANGEFSVEANPWGLDVDKVAVLADAGVNRISLGVQAFDDETLAFLERDHRAQDIEKGVHLVRERIPNLSLDLIFGVPTQSLDLWQETLSRAVALEPRHISTYGLTYEKGTSFWTRREKGQLSPAAEDEREMYALTMDTLPAASYEQYEISNFAQPGFACRHNQVYWAGLPYFGFGPGAARYIDGKRQTNHRSVTSWINRLLQRQSGIFEEEQLAPEERARELVFLGLRRATGINLAEFRVQSGFDLKTLAEEALYRNQAAGLLEEVGGSIRLTREGRFVADSVIADFL